jgi:hypothetical protein
LLAGQAARARPKPSSRLGPVSRPIRTAPGSAKLAARAIICNCPAHRTEAVRFRSNRGACSMRRCSGVPESAWLRPLLSARILRKVAWSHCMSLLLAVSRHHDRGSMSAFGGFSGHRANRRECPLVTKGGHSRLNGLCHTPKEPQRAGPSRRPELCERWKKRAKCCGHLSGFGKEEQEFEAECAIRLRAHGVQSPELSARAQPLGSVSRMRLAVCLASRQVRRKLNMVDYEQPAEARSFGRTSADADAAECRE